MVTKKLIAVIIIVVLSLSSLFAGTTGKITGIIKDKENGEPAAGVNVLIEGTRLGAATDLDGVYTILNIPPGIYNIQAMMIDFKTITKTQIQVFADRTTRIDFDLEIAIIEGETIEV